MTALQGRCHCGAVTLTLTIPPAELSECNCSICRRLAGLWHYCEGHEVAIAGPQAGYVQGDRTLTTWRCANCGCVTNWTATDPNYQRVGVNMRMFDPAVWQDLPRRQIDGASY